MSRVVIVNLHGQLLAHTIRAIFARGNHSVTVVLQGDSDEDRDILTDEGAHKVYFNVQLQQATQLVEMFSGADTLLLTLDTRFPFVLAHYKFVVDAAFRADIRSIVFLSHLGTVKTYPAIPQIRDSEGQSTEAGRLEQLDYVARYRAVEEYILDREWFLTTFIRPAISYQDLRMWNRHARDRGSFAFPLPGDVPFSLLDDRDIAAVAAAAIVSPEEHADEEYILTGKEMMTLNELVHLINEFLPEQEHLTVTQANAPADWHACGYDEDWGHVLHELFEETYEHLSTITDDLECVLNDAPTPFRRHIQTFILFMGHENIRNKTARVLEQFETSMEHLTQEIQESVVSFQLELAAKRQMIENEIEEARHALTSSEKEDNSATLLHEEDEREHSHLSLESHSATIEHAAADMRSALLTAEDSVHQATEAMSSLMEDFQSEVKEGRLTPHSSEASSSAHGHQELPEESEERTPPSESSPTQLINVETESDLENHWENNPRDQRLMTPHTRLQEAGSDSLFIPAGDHVPDAVHDEGHEEQGPYFKPMITMDNLASSLDVVIPTEKVSLRSPSLAETSEEPEPLASEVAEHESVDLTDENLTEEERQLRRRKLLEESRNIFNSPLHAQIARERSSSSDIIIDHVELPTKRPAWIPDTEAPHCMICHTRFNFLHRRHHCRNCGKVVDSKCAHNRLRLPNLQFYSPVRVCTECFNLYSTVYEPLMAAFRENSLREASS